MEVGAIAGLVVAGSSLVGSAIDSSDIFDFGYFVGFAIFSASVLLSLARYEGKQKWVWVATGFGGIVTLLAGTVGIAERRTSSFEPRTGNLLVNICLVIGTIPAGGGLLFLEMGRNSEGQYSLVLVLKWLAVLGVIFGAASCRFFLDSHSVAFFTLISVSALLVAISYCSLRYFT